VYGGDLWLRVASPLELTGQAAYNRSTREMASQRYAARVMPGARVDISGGYETYTYKSLFQTTLNPAFFPPSIDNDDKVRVIFGVVDWEIVPGWTIELAGKNIRHDNVATGNANRGEIAIRRAYNGGKDVAGISAAAVTADREENEYREIRGFHLVPGEVPPLPRRPDPAVQEGDQREEERVADRRVRGVPILPGVPALRRLPVDAESHLQQRLRRAGPRDPRPRHRHGREEMMRRVLAMNIILAAVLALSFGCSAVSQTPSVPPKHPEELPQGRADCLECHKDVSSGALKPYASFRHSRVFVDSHGLYARQAQNLCSACHAPAFCQTCHAAKGELKPNTLMGDRPDRTAPHRGYSSPIGSTVARPGSCFLPREPERRQGRQCHK
jgi:hypothetical protein